MLMARSGHACGTPLERLLCRLNLLPGASNPNRVGIQDREVEAVNLLFFTVEIERSHVDKRALMRRAVPGSRPKRGRLRWLGLALAGLACASAAAVGGWVLLGGDPMSLSLPDWFPVGTGWASGSAANSAQLVIASRPDKATVLLDSHQRGQTPLSLPVARGPHTLVLKHPEAVDEQRQISISNDLDVRVNMWQRHPDAVQLRPAYPGASISDVAFLADGRLALTMVMPGQVGSAAASTLREPWIFDPASGSLDPFKGEAIDARAAALAVSPDGRQVASLRPSTAQSGAIRARGPDEVWVASGDDTATPARVFVLPPLDTKTASVSAQAEELHDLVWTPDGQHLLVTARLIGAGASHAAAPRSRLLLVDTTVRNQQEPNPPVELVILPAEVVSGSYTWAADGRWVAFLTRASVASGSADFLALCALDTSAGGAVAGFRYVADLGRQTDPAALLPVASVAWTPDLDRRLVYTAATPKIAASNLFGLPTTSGGDTGLFVATPGGQSLGAEQGRRLGTGTGLLAPAWLGSVGPGGANLVALARAEQGNKALVLRGVDPVDGTVRNLGVELPAGVGGAAAFSARWDLVHGQLLVLSRRRDNSSAGLLDYWLVQLQAPTITDATSTQGAH